MTNRSEIDRQIYLTNTIEDRRNINKKGVSSNVRTKRKNPRSSPEETWREEEEEEDVIGLANRDSKYYHIFVKTIIHSVKWIVSFTFAVDSITLAANEILQMTNHSMVTNRTILQVNLTDFATWNWEIVKPRNLGHLNFYRSISTCTIELITLLINSNFTSHELINNIFYWKHTKTY